MQTLILVEDSSPLHAGGTQLLYSSLAAQGDRDILMRRTRSSDVLSVLEEARGPAIVFSQRSGELSRPYLALATAWLEAGAVVVEKNVFAKASAFRPNHPNYYMALLSWDGAYRYVNRSLGALLPRQERFLLLPNPLYRESLISPERYAFGGASDKKLRLLRIGRPDPIKWSAFEENFSRSLASDGWDVVLTRVGYPDAPRPPATPGLRIVDVPYGVDLSPHYGSNDVYLHHSRIGETYGNTLLEAVHSGLRVVLGADLQWDLASLEFLTGWPHVVGSPVYLTTRATEVVESLVQQELRAAPPIFAVPDYLEELLRVGRGVSLRVHAMPKWSAAREHYGALARSFIDDRRPRVERALALDGLRALKHRRDEEAIG